MYYINNIIILVRIFFVASYEFLLYKSYGDYSDFIFRITHKLADINILYVKIFQAFALNNSLIDDKINNQLLSFTDKAPWKEYDIDYNTLVHLEMEKGLQLIHGFVPINSGMISLVFKAKSMMDDKIYIIKMKRNNIDEKLKEAIENLLFLMNLFSLIPFVKEYQLSEIVDKNIDIIKHQVNFHEEVENMILMKKNCKNLKYVVIPTVYKEVTDELHNIIFMDFIEGVPINKIEIEDYEPFAKQVLKFGFVTSMIHGVTHGDLHSGNILFIKDEKEENPKYRHKIGVLDFGIIYNVDNLYKGVLFEIITEMFSLPPKVIATKIINSGIIEPIDVLQSMPIHHYERIVKILEDIVEETVHSSKKANQIQIYKFISSLRSYLTDHEISNLGLTLSDSFVKTQLVLAMAHGITLTLCKDNYMDLANVVINELFHTDMIVQ
jgi:predicted unusual protein kinase regulating ubiquinone biosynthesis (AarF/ABC1/UbiB family)